MNVPDARPEGVSDAEYVEMLERENRLLREANAKLTREHLGSSNTAAAARLVSGSRSGAPLRTLGSHLLAPLRKLRLAARRLALRLLR